MAGIEAVFAAEPRQHWLDHLRANGIPCGPVNTSEQAVDDPQVVANDYLTEFDQPGVGRMRSYAPPVRMSASDPTPLGPAPAIGADTDAVCEQLGLDADLVADLRADGVLH